MLWKKDQVVRNQCFIYLSCVFLFHRAGFERTIPSFPRYTVTGSEELGEHHMRIENATLDDDAEYQCQIGPNGSAKPIRADARLTVLSKNHLQTASARERERERDVKGSIT